MKTGPLLLVLSLLASCQGDKGEPGDPGSSGNPGTSTTTGTITGTVTDGVKHDALGGVAVTAADAGGLTLSSATTSSDGSFSLTVTAGAVDLSFAKDLYTPPGVLHAGVGLGQTVHLAVTMNEAATGKPSVSLAASGDDFGYGVAVPLAASAADPNGDTLTYAWKNATWPVLGAVTGTATSGTATMPTLQEAFAFRPDSQNPGQFISGYTIPDRFGIVPITTDTRGQITATVTVSDGRGQATTASLTINAASVEDSVRNVPVNQRIYLNSGHDETNAWTLTPPAGSTATLATSNARITSFVADKPGAYTLAEGANTMTITAGSFRGIVVGGNAATGIQIDGYCKICHQNDFAGAPPDMFTPWAKTGHATMFTNGINGDLSDHYSGACVGCHTVGFDQGVAAGGFDDAARSAAWSFPNTLDASNWDSMLIQAPSVAKLANIQCESCHGPQNSDAHMGTYDANKVAQPFLSPRISYASEACATCHGAGAHHLYSEWTTTDATGMGHANRASATSIASSATGLNSNCGRCHAAQGFMLYADILNKGKVALNTVPAATLAQITPKNAEPVTCQTCHDPHDATNPNQLRFYGDTPNLPSGFAGHGMGKGALCLVCHNSRNGAQTGSDALTYLHEDGEPYNAGNPTGYSAPHQAAQGDVFEGRNAYFMGASLPMVSKHSAITDTCVGCHMTLQPKGYLSHGTPTHSGHLFRIESEDKQTLCANCHGATVDGEGIQAQVESQLVAIANKMGNAFKAKTAGITFTVRAWDEATDTYSSASASNVTIAPGTVTSVGIEEIHGQVGFVLTLSAPITIPFTGGAKTTNTFGVQMGAVKDATGTTALYGLNGNMVRAGWNYFLIEGDQSKGLHNPGFANAVLNNTLAKDLSN